MSLSVGNTERLLPLEGSFNFRDLGGYSSRHGGTVRWRRLFRADGLHRLSADDLDLLRNLGLSTVIDLRTASEVDERGRIDGPHDRVDYYHLPMIDVLPDRGELPAWVDASFVAERYAVMLAEGEATIVEALAILTDPVAYPAVFHCAAGKDRTGILSALVLGLLGVADEDIVADYALSAKAMIRMFDWLQAQYPDKAKELQSSAAAIVTVEPQTMSLFLGRFRADHGTFEDYAASVGMARAVAPLRAALLAS